MEIHLGHPADAPIRAKGIGFHSVPPIRDSCQPRSLSIDIHREFGLSVPVCSVAIATALFENRLKQVLDIGWPYIVYGHDGANSRIGQYLWQTGLSNPFPAVFH